jgi:DNA-binding HxlR family transcriptional regulator
VLGELCKQHFIEIILLLRESPRSFNELLKLLNAYPDTLNRRLKELSKMGVIVQTQENKKIKYKLTEKGSQIAELLEELLEIMEKLRKIVEIEKKFKKP